MAGIASLALPASAAFAQESGPAQAEANTTDASEIIVTATRRAERLRDVPISVTAVSGAQIEQAQIRNVSDLYGRVPGVSLAPGVGSVNELQVGIRGLVPGALETTVDPSVGIYIDGVYVARPVAANTAFIDMERVEVLRGPQGTLFGRNTIGGAFNITTRKPEDYFEGSVEVGYGNFNRLTATGMINLPVSETVQARLVYNHHEHDGYARSLALNEDIYDRKQDYVRASVRVAPSERFEMLLIGDYFKFSGASQFYKLNYLAAGSPLAAFQTPDFYTNNAGFNPRTTNEAYNATAIITAENDIFTVKSISAYRHVAATRGADLDGVPQALRDFVAFPTKNEQISQEVQFYGSAMNGRLDWIVGGYYFYEQGSSAIELDVGAPVIIVNTRIPKASNASVSGFAQLTYEIADNLKLTGGIRRVHDTRNASYVSGSALTVGGPLVACSLPAATGATLGNCYYKPPQATYNFTPWTVGVDYKPSDDLLLYGKVSRGYRSGGFQTQAAALAQLGIESFGPEALTSYEAGFKATMLNGAVQLNAAAFHSKYKGIQQTQNFTVAGPPSFTFAAITNAGTARLNGGEVELTARLGNFNLSANYALVDAKFLSGPSVGGDYLITPKHTYGLAAGYETDVAGGKLRLGVDYNYRSTVRFYDTAGFSALQAAAVSQKGYGLLNANASFEFKPVTITVWGKNLTDKEYFARTQNFVAAGFNVGAVGEPATYGASVKYTF